MSSTFLDDSVGDLRALASEPVMDEPVYVAEVSSNSILSHLRFLKIVFRDFCSTQTVSSIRRGIVDRHLSEFYLPRSLEYKFQRTANQDNFCMTISFLLLASIAFVITRFMDTFLSGQVLDELIFNGTTTKGLSNVTIDDEASIISSRFTETAIATFVSSELFFVLASILLVLFLCLPCSRRTPLVYKALIVLLVLLMIGFGGLAYSAIVGSWIGMLTVLLSMIFFVDNLETYLQGVLMFIIVVGTLVSDLAREVPPWYIVSNQFMFWFCFWYSIDAMWTQKRTVRRLFISREVASKKTKMLMRLQTQNEVLVQTLLPSSIVHRLKTQNFSIANSESDTTTIVDFIPITSIGFISINNFGEILDQVNESELILILNRIFSDFDECVERHGLYRVKTIGSNYLIVNGLFTNENSENSKSKSKSRRDREENEIELKEEEEEKVNENNNFFDFFPETKNWNLVEKMLHVCFAMLDLVKEFHYGFEFLDDPISIQIGIHAGPLVAGCIGNLKKKIDYDIWGDAVNMSSRLAHAFDEPNEICIAAETFEDLSEPERYHYRSSPVFLKGKGEIQCGLLKERQESRESRLARLKDCLAKTKKVSDKASDKRRKRANDREFVRHMLSKHGSATSSTSRHDSVASAYSNSNSRSSLSARSRSVVTVGSDLSLRSVESFDSSDRSLRSSSSVGPAYHLGRAFRTSTHQNRMFSQVMGMLVQDDPDDFDAVTRTAMSDDSGSSLELSLRDAEEAEVLKEAADLFEDDLLDEYDTAISEGRRVRLHKMIHWSGMFKKWELNKLFFHRFFLRRYMTSNRMLVLTQMLAFMLAILFDIFRMHYGDSMMTGFSWYDPFIYRWAPGSSLVIVTLLSLSPLFKNFYGNILITQIFLLCNVAVHFVVSYRYGIGDGVVYPIFEWMIMIVIGASLNGIHFAFKSINALLILPAYYISFILGNKASWGDVVVQSGGLYLIIALGFMKVIRNEYVGLENFVFKALGVKRAELLELSQQENGELIRNLLPPRVMGRLGDYAKMMNGDVRKMVIADHFGEVSFIYGDIVNFTATTSGLSPLVLVQRLNNLFQHYDEITEKRDMERVALIGDCYVAVAGVESFTRTHQLSAALCAIEMLEFSNDEENCSFTVRFGLHCGPCHAGVVGKTRFRYDFYGRVVVVAEEYESTGEGGRLHCSREFMRAYCHRRCQAYGFEEREDQVMIDGTPTTTYWLVGKQAVGRLDERADCQMTITVDSADSVSSKTSRTNRMDIGVEPRLDSEPDVVIVQEVDNL